MVAGGSTIWAAQRKNALLIRSSMGLSVIASVAVWTQIGLAAISVRIDADAISAGGDRKVGGLT